MSSEKKRAVDHVDETELRHPEDDDSNSSGMEDDDCEDDDAMEGIEQVVNVEFEARQPQDSDFHGIRKLLQQLFLKAQVNLSDLTNTILEQNYVGSVIKQSDFIEDGDSDGTDEDGDVFGVISVINITEKKDNESHQLIRSFVEEKCAACGEEKVAQLHDVLHSDAQVGLLLSERFVNIPPQIAPPMYVSLLKDMDLATRKKMKYAFDYYLMIIKTYKMPISIPGSRRHKKPADHPENMQTIYTSPEEELLHKEAVMSCEYCVEDEHDTIVDGAWDSDEGGMKPYRTILILKADKLKPIVETMIEQYSPPA